MVVPAPEPIRSTASDTASKYLRLPPVGVWVLGVPRRSGDDVLSLDVHQIHEAGHVIGLHAEGYGGSWRRLPWRLRGLHSLVRWASLATLVRSAQFTAISDEIGHC